MNVSLTPELEQMIREKVASGRYNNASEVIREGLRRLEERDERLQTLRDEMQRGIDQIARGESVLVDDDYFDRIDREVDQELAVERTQPVSDHAPKAS